MSYSPTLGQISGRFKLLRLSLVVDRSTLKGEDQSMPDTQIKLRKIVGISLSPELAIAVKAEAAGRDITIRKLFEEMWDLYNATKKNT
jgi:hypothetical protein